MSDHGRRPGDCMGGWIISTCLRAIDVTLDNSGLSSAPLASMARLHRGRSPGETAAWPGPPGAGQPFQEEVW